MNIYLNQFIEFLKEENPDDTLHKASFRFLQFCYDQNRNRKSWIVVEQASDAPAFETLVKIEGHIFSFSERIGDILDALQMGR